MSLRISYRRITDSTHNYGLIKKIFLIFQCHKFKIIAFLMIHWFKSWNCISLQRHNTSAKENVSSFKINEFSLFRFWPCLWVPYCIDSCKSAVHTCPQCQAYIGIYDNWLHLKPYEVVYIVEPCLLKKIFWNVVIYMLALEQFKNWKHLISKFWMNFKLMFDTVLLLQILFQNSISISKGIDFNVNYTFFI